MMYIALITVFHPQYKKGTYQIAHFLVVAAITSSTIRRAIAMFKVMVISIGTIATTITAISTRLIVILVIMM